MNKDYYDLVNNEICPVLNSVNTFLSEHKTEGLAYDFALISWRSFYRNSLAFFDIFPKENCFNQLAMTARLFMEISADTLHVSRDLTVLDDLLEKYEETKKILKTGTYDKIGKELRRINIGSSTEKRVEAEYGEYELNAYYSRYSAFSHFNFAAVIESEEKHTTGQKEYTEFALELVGYYPAVLRKELTAIGKIIGKNLLGSIIIADIDKAINKIVPVETHDE